MSEIYLRIEVKLISFSCGLIPNDSGANRCSWYLQKGLSYILSDLTKRQVGNGKWKMYGKCSCTMKSELAA